MPSRFSRSRTSSCAIVLIAAPGALRAQENYEIQVYGSETIPRGVTMFELHSNYTINGTAHDSSSASSPTNHAVHETLEITHGLNELVGARLLLVHRPSRTGAGLQWVGTHIRPRVRAPESWGWPVGVSISQEIGYARPQFSADTWTYELRPIIDKQMGRWYVSLNPVLGKSLRGPNASQAVRVHAERRRRLRRHEEGQPRARVLRRDRHDQPHRSDRRAGAPVVLRRQPRPRAGLGVQPRLRHRAHRGGRQEDREDDPRPSRRSKASA